MLKLSLVLLERGGEARIREEIAPDSPLWDGLNLALSAPVRVDLTAREVGDSILVRGTIHASAQGECRRCLTEVDRRVDTDVNFLFAPMEDEDEEVDGEVYPLPDRGNELDLSAPVREALVLHLPEYVLCQDECRGLCPQCGTDLNQGTCECVPEEKGSPWEALRKLNFD
jgi:uncharacterized protein